MWVGAWALSPRGVVLGPIVRNGSLNAVRYALAPLPAALLTLAGCSYASDYVPPADGRARAVWAGDRVVMSLALPPESACSAEIHAADGWSLGSVRSGHAHVHGHVAVWVPIYYGPPIHPVVPGRAPPIHTRPTVAPRPVGRTPAVVQGGRAGAGVHVSSDRTDDLMKRLFVVAAVAALIALPATAIALASGHPEPTDEVAAAIDDANEFNDSARQPDSPCNPALFVEGEP
jgi:hypothetical protein